MSECTHDCSGCSQNCADRDPKSLLAAPNPLSSIKKVIAVMSGKGGVGKSMVSSLLASELQKQGLHTGILDADITGPSIPKTFGVTGPVGGTEAGLLPVRSCGGVDIMSINLLLEHETDPVAWRGPIIAGTVKQFWTDVIWNDIDVLLVDMPPGTGDVPLTVFQSLPVDAAIMVTSPQDLVSMIVSKAVNLTGMMNIKLLGIVENMSYLVCPDCGKKIEVFGKSHVEEVAKEQGLTVLDRMPIDPAAAEAVDAGRIESLPAGKLEGAVAVIKDLL
ncbi:MAG: Mrp/NBP35 family ATP-binding protein [Lachnospiraceae bacterium]|nr:Mrp/NBP35 family ATP-binding protein [Lachnospiraceae bacterium]